MRILGIDPGVAITGFGIVDWREGEEAHLAHCGFVGTSSKEKVPERLERIFRELSGIIEVYQPEEVAVEELFFNKNSKTAISVGEARGVVLLCAALHGLPVYEYTPLEVKQAIVGYGRATKNQVIYMVGKLLSIAERITPDDVADALAVALCHAFSLRMRREYA
ncbi:MAG: crossover junction endodeoxyribonuclease RuvC [Candidatus Caldatribacteriaceae bacterium]